MAPTLSQYTQIREALVDQVLTFLASGESNFFGRTIRFLDRPPDAADVWGPPSILAIYWEPATVEFQTEDRRHVAGNTTSVATMSFKGYTEGDWSTIEALEVDCRRAVLENPGLNCLATSSLWQTLTFGIEVQHKEQSQDRRCWFEATLAVQTVEGF